MSLSTTAPKPDALLLARITRHDTVEDVASVLQSVKCYPEMRGEQSLTLLVLNAVMWKLPHATAAEAAEIVIDALKTVFQLDGAEMERIRKDVEFLLANGKKLIQKTPGMLKRAKRFFFGKSKK